MALSFLPKGAAILDQMPKKHNVRVKIHGFSSAVVVTHGGVSLLRCISKALITLTGEVVDADKIRRKISVMRHYDQSRFEELDVYIDDQALILKERARWPWKIVHIDEAHHIENTRSNLVRAGFEVIGLTHSLKALEVIEAQRPELVILEPHLPFNGFEIMRAVRANAKTENIKFMFIHRDRRDSFAYEILCAEVDAHLEKPVNPLEVPVYAKSVLDIPMMLDEEAIYEKRNVQFNPHAPLEVIGQQI
jgi:CheY-like chemotaxis protein